MINQTPLHLDYVLTPSQKEFRFFATVARGFESVLSNEIQTLFSSLSLPVKVFEEVAGCSFIGSWKHAWAANMGLMLPSRILCILTETTLSHEADIYAAASRIPWPEVFGVEKTFSVHASTNDIAIQNSMHVSLRVKDALCDVFRQSCGQRPNVSSENPDVRIFVRYVHRKLSISVDTSGAPLFERGYRTRTVEAPLKENMAAALLHLTGFADFSEHIWKSEEPFFVHRKGASEGGRIPAQVPLSPFIFDGFCGSGTLLIEAALSLLHWKPQVRRPFFALSHLFPARALEIEKTARDIKNKIIANEKSVLSFLSYVQEYKKRNHIVCRDDILAPLRGGDIHKKSIQVSQECADNAGVGSCIYFAPQNVLTAKPHASQGLAIMNPPYGERLEMSPEELRALYRGWGDTFKQRFSSWNAWLLSGSKDAIKNVGLRHTRKFNVYNGNLECQFLQYVLY